MITTTLHQRNTNLVRYFRKDARTRIYRALYGQGGPTSEPTQ